MSCDPQILSVESAIFKGVAEGNKLNILIYLFAQIAGVTIDPEVLSEAAKCFQCIPEGNKMNVLLYLACNFQGGGTGNTCLVCVAGSGSPADPPTSGCTCAIAYNEQQNFWFWKNSSSAWIPVG